MIRKHLQPVTFLCTLVIAAGITTADSVQLAVTKDNSLVMVDGEWQENAGDKGQIRIKGNQHLVAMAFDLKPILGQRIRSANLRVVAGEQKLSGISISTLATPWDELKSNGLSAGVEGIPDWGYLGARLPAVCGGNSFTLVSQIEVRLVDGHYEWSVPVDMIHAMATGVAHGLVIHEHEADYSRNPTIFSREQSGRKPLLIVETDNSADVAPEPARDLRIIESDDALQVQLTPPKNGFAYEVFVDDVPLGRHNIPLVQLQNTQIIPLRDLPPAITSKSELTIRIVTLNRTGQRSEAAVARYQSTRHGDEIRRVDSKSADQPAVASQASKSEFAAIPVTDKFDESGIPVGDLDATYRIRNSIFDGSKIQLTAAGGEVVGFQLLIRGRESESLAVEFEGLPLRIDLWQAVYVPANDRRIPDPLLPLPETLLLKPDRDTSVVADIFVPFDAPPGVRKGVARLSGSRTLPIELTVLPFSLPRKASFLCEMNGYGLPDHVNDYYALQQVAYDHRVHSNILHYSHNTAAPGSRKSNLDMRLRSGRRMDNKRYDNISPGATTAYWDDFAEAFGPFLDGSLFQDGHRGPVAAPGFYLTFHESWPLNCRGYFNGNPDAYQAFSDHPEYSQTYVNILQDFARLARSKNWTDTGFQVYFNNKGSMQELSKAPWILDEPAAFWDYRALRYYGDLTDRGRMVEPEISLDYRIDISRPEFARGQLDGRPDLWVVSSSAFRDYRRLVTDRIERDGLKVWIYGTSNHVHESNRNLQAWALDSWQHGATGIVPWQTVNKDGSALTKADQLGLFIYDRDQSGEVVVRHSLRLKAYRDTEQLIEYLTLLKQRRQWSQQTMREFVGQFVQFSGSVQKLNDDDAGTSSYDRLSAHAIDAMKREILRLLKE
jgi:hypothetical protein